MSYVVNQAMRYTVGVAIILGSLLTVMMTGCGKPEPTAPSGPQLLTREAVSVVDGMILLDYPGPKGQMVKKDATTEYFCDVPELINAVRDADYGRTDVRAYVQAFDGREWGSYADGWVEVSRPLYVLGSDRMGAMGPTLVPFLTPEAARAFTEKHGGRILRYADLTPEVMAEHARMSRAMLRRGGMAGHQAGPMPGHGTRDHANGH